MRKFIAFMSFNFLLLSSASVFAQGHSLYCGNADSTASTQSCLKRHLDAAQNRLKKNYNKLSLQLEGEKKAELEALQKTWLSYRDAECMWEVENTENKSLKKINELSCMARLTDDRADILSILNNEKVTAEGAREYGSFPRWMNALAGAHGGVYWNYGDRKGFDLNCDGEEEFIMRGYETTDYKQVKNSENEDEALPILFQKNAVIAVTQNPAVGKPVPTIFKFFIGNDEGTNTLCSGNFDLKMVAGATLDTEESEGAEAICQAKLEIKPNGCDDIKTIVWSGKDFIIAPEISENIEAQK